MHIYDPRPWAEDEYFLKQSDGQVLPIDAARFFTATETEVGGVALDPWRACFSLGLNGVTMSRRDPRSPIFAAKFVPQSYQPESLAMLGKLANLEQIELRDCPVTDTDLQRLPMLYKLRGIGLNGTRVTLAGLRHLLKYPQLTVVQFGNANWTLADLQAMLEQSE
jgi:hypothetical protein